MVEKYGLFDSLEGDEREYAEVDFARLGRVLGLDGVRGGKNALSVSAAPAGLGVNVNVGLALIQGRYYELEDDGSGAFTLNLSEAGNNPRVDRIVLTLDFTARTVRLGVLKGIEAASPAAPELTRNTSQYMLSLARVYVAVGAGALDSADITDERHDENVCGIFIASADSALAAANAAQKAADSKAPAAHASPGTEHGVGTESSYGHVRLSDSTNSASAAGEGVAASPKAVKAAYDLAKAAVPKVSGATEGHIPAFKADGTLASSGVAMSGFHRCKFTLSGTTLTITTVS